MMPSILSFLDTIISPKIQGEAPIETKTIARTKKKFEQPKEQTSLLCTTELETARSHYSGLQFDLKGDKERCLYGLNPPKWDTESGELPPTEPADVLRVTQIFKEPQFFIDGANSSDVAQGYLSNCWFMSAVATVATTEGLIERICIHRDEQVGVYGFLFYHDSG
ncbi:hypothetical protein FRC11_014510, partial [Ceratobasidium sp. 423]